MTLSYYLISPIRKSALGGRPPPAGPVAAAAATTTTAPHLLLGYYAFFSARPRLVSIQVWEWLVPQSSGQTERNGLHRNVKGGLNILFNYIRMTCFASGFVFCSFFPPIFYPLPKRYQEGLCFRPRAGEATRGGERRPSRCGGSR